jgi:hypothetical protein
MHSQAFQPHDFRNLHISMIFYNSKAKVFKNSLCYTFLFLKQYFAIAKLEIELPYTCDIRPFLSVSFPFILSNGYSIPFHLLAITKWFISTFFPIFLFPFYFFTRLIFFLF